MEECKVSLNGHLISGTYEEVKAVQALIFKSEKQTRMLTLAWDAICEAGYEDCHAELKRYFDEQAD